MKTAVYFFSGTGNSLCLAKGIAARLDADLMPVAPLMRQDVIETQADAIGLVFPVYYGELPVIVKNFANKLRGITGKYIFAVCNFGGGKSHSLEILSKIIAARGGVLCAGYGIHMPQNAFRKAWENNEKIIAKAENKLDIVASNTLAMKRGTFFSNVPLDLLLKPMHVLFKPLYVKSFLKLTNAPADTPFDELIALSDRSFKTNEMCNGCGLCAQVCPVQNIVLTEGVPVWQHHCQDCLACYNWCPNRAIEGSIAQKGYYYRHPKVKISEFMNSTHA